MAWSQARGSMREDGEQAEGAREVAGELDLTPYIHTSAPAVPETFSLERAYALFRALGARHLTVVDAHNRVKGVVTRKDLLGFRLDEAVDRAQAAGLLPSALSASSSRLRAWHHPGSP